MKKSQVSYDSFHYAFKEIVTRKADFPFEKIKKRLIWSSNQNDGTFLPGFYNSCPVLLP